MKTRTWLGISCLLLAGCVSIGNSELANDATVAQIKVGETTKEQVASLLGEPASQRSIEMSGWTQEWWVYSYAAATINPLDYLLLYGFFFNGIGLYDTEYDLSLFFDPRGIVSSFSRLKTDYDMGRPFASMRVSSVVNTTIGVSAGGKEPVQFEDKLEYRY